MVDNGLEPSEDLKALRELTPRLKIPYPPVSGQGSLREIVVEEGSCFCTPFPDLAAEPGASCAKFFNSKGKFPLHNHEQREWLIIFEGSMVAYLDREKELAILKARREALDRRIEQIEAENGQMTGIELKSGQSIVIEPGVEHYSIFPEDCRTLAVTVPATKDWPECCVE
jgi:quercetin dioxygenase-like cupin family protein